MLNTLPAAIPFPPRRPLAAPLPVSPGEALTMIFPHSGPVVTFDPFWWYEREHSFLFTFFSKHEHQRPGGSLDGDWLWCISAV